MSDFKLVQQPMSEMLTEVGKKKLTAKRIYKKHECANRINKLLNRGDNDVEHVDKEVWRIFNDMEFTEKELRDCMFSRLKQSVLKMVHSHEKATGEHRSIYRAKDGQINIYTTRDAKALKHLIKSLKGRAASYQTTINDAICQLYRINHNLENYQQVNLFDAITENGTEG